MAGGDSSKAVVAAIVGNSIVMVAKFVAFAMTGSGAMLSEGIHTLADVFNQVLLFVGIRSSRRPADRVHPYGYGAERYVWALMSAVGIFFLGCGVTIAHGVHTWSHPEPVRHITTAVVVLIIAFVFEGVVLLIAWRELRLAADGRPFYAYLRDDADPTAVAVLLEDAVACGGCLVALAAIVATRVTGDARWDALGSITIGLLLGFVALFLVIRNRRNLVGPGISAQERAHIEAVIEGNPTVERVVKLRTRLMGHDSYRVQADVEFDGVAIASKLEGRLRSAWEGIESYGDFRDFAARYADQVVEMLGDEVDRVEDQIREQVPRVQDIDIETE